MPASRRSSRRSTRRASKKNNQMGGKRKTGRKGKGTPWTDFVKKIHQELKKKNPDAKLGDAMKEASRRKSEM